MEIVLMSFFAILLMGTLFFICATHYTGYQKIYEEYLKGNTYAAILMQKGLTKHIQVEYELACRVCKGNKKDIEIVLTRISNK